MQKVTVQYLPDYNLAQLLASGQHAFVADELEEDGGNGLGPDPYELLLWALGACTSMTVLLYARRKGWDVAEVSVHLNRERRHAEDCPDAEGKAGLIDCIEREISVRGDLTEEQQERLLEIANRCPVHRTLISSPQIMTKLIAGT